MKTRILWENTLKLSSFLYFYLETILYLAVKTLARFMTLAVTLAIYVLANFKIKICIINFNTNVNL